MVSKKTRYQATLKRTAEHNKDPLVRYRAEDLSGLLDEIGRMDSFDYHTFIRTVDRMEVSTDGKVAVIFLAGVRITI
jgi:molybdenum cofactor biosynthesis enzyme MoaA